VVKDLSTIHHPLSGLFQYPATREEWDPYKLPEEQVLFFRENGYLSGIKLFNDEVVEHLRQELKDLTDPKHQGNGLFHEFHSNESNNMDEVLFHALGAWRIKPGFHDILWNPAFVMAATQLLGGPIRFWHDQLFVKPAGHGGVVAWHQDYAYWTRTIPIQHLTCWTGLDDSTLENGCVHYVPGSHQWGLLDKPNLAGNMDGVFEFLNAGQKAQFKPIPIELKKGYGTFHHPLLIHGSYANKSERPRRGVVLNVFRDGTISDTDEILMQGTPPIGKGNPVAGQFHPLLGI